METLDRRAFLKKTSAALAVAGVPAIIPSRLWAAKGAAAPSNRITLGFVGVGDHGIKVNLNNFISNSDVRVLALCDVDSKHLAQAKEVVQKKYAESKTHGTDIDCATTKDFREVVGRDDIDAVVVSTPDHWHVPISLAAIRAGKDVYCEKPISVSIDEGRILSDEAKKHSRVFQTGSEFRGLHNFLRAAELVRNGRIGKLHTITAYLPCNPNRPGDSTPMKVPPELDYDMWLGPAPWAPYTKDRVHFDFRWIFDYSGGTICDWGAHLLDQAQWANDTEYSGPTEIEGTGTFLSEGLFNTAIKFHVEYKYENGVKLICTDKIQKFNGGIRYEGSEGSIYAKYPTWSGKTLKSEPESILKSKIGPDETHLYTCPAGPERNLLDCIRSRKLTYYPAEVGHRSSTICHLGNVAMMLQRKIKWDPKKEKFVNDDEANRMLSRPMRSPWRL
jgi:predicted dehydrogenase